MNLDRALDFRRVCASCLAQDLCAGYHPPCVAAAESMSDSALSGVVGPRDVRLPDWLADVGGTLELDYAPSGGSDTDLPLYIPVLERHSPGLALPAWPVYGLHLDAAITPRRLDVTDCARDLRSYFPTAPETRFILFCYARDYAIEEIWARRAASSLVAKLMATDFDLIVAPNFSVYLDQPRMTHLLRIRMSHVLYRAMMEAGLSVIPHAYFGATRDIDRWGRWFAENSLVRVAACNLQTATDAAFRRWMLRGLRKIREAAGRHLHYVISGPSTRDRLQETFGELGPDVTIANCVPHQVAAKRHVLMPDGSREFSPEDYFDRLENSIVSMESMVRQARSKSPDQRAEANYLRQPV